MKNVEKAFGNLKNRLTFVAAKIKSNVQRGTGKREMKKMKNVFKNIWKIKNFTYLCSRF